MTNSNRTFIAVLATAVIALAVPAGAQAAPCIKSFPTPAGGSFDITSNGSLNTRVLTTANGRAWEGGHGALSVEGVAYPAIAGSGCITSANVLAFPARNLNGMIVSRSVSSSNGLVRVLDTITNTGDAKYVGIDWAIKVQDSQRIHRDSQGGTSVDRHDDWVLLGDKTFASLTWTDGSGYKPEVISSDPDQSLWQTDGPFFPDAKLSFLPYIAKNQTARILNVMSVEATQPAGVARADDTVPVMAGFSKALAKQIVNWGPDSDQDGVSSSSDDCPGVKGNQPDGCVANVPPPPPADPPADPAPNPNPGPGPGPGTGTGTGPTGGTGPTPSIPPVIRDTAKPKILVGGLARSIGRLRLARTGLKPRIRCSERCKLVVALQVRRVRSRRATTLTTFRRSGLSALDRKPVFKVRSPRLVRLARQRVTLVITATDASGNRSTLTRQVTLTR